MTTTNSPTMTTTETSMTMITFRDSLPSELQLALAWPAPNPELAAAAAAHALYLCTADRQEINPLNVASQSVSDTFYQLCYQLHPYYHTGQHISREPGNRVPRKWRDHLSLPLIPHSFSFSFSFLFLFPLSLSSFLFLFPLSHLNMSLFVPKR